MIDACHLLSLERKESNLYLLVKQDYQSRKNQIYVIANAQQSYFLRVWTLGNN